MTEQSYLNLLDELVVKADQVAVRGDRTGVGTYSVFGRQIRFDLAEGFPLLTTKKVHFKSVLEELLWFLRGDTNVKALQAQGVRIWNEWSDEDGNLGPVYGEQWRGALGARKVGEAKDGRPIYHHIRVDQILKAQHLIRTDPNSRRIIVDSWNPAQLNEMALTPCHCLFQFYVDNGRLSCQLYQRSADIFLGVPFNIASYAALTMMMAKSCGLKPGEFVHTFGDVHLYSNHVEQAKEQLSRSPRPLPYLAIYSENETCITGYDRKDFELIEYDPHPPIAAKVAV